MIESTGRHVVIVESKIANSRVGTRIWASDELDHAAATELLGRIVSGQEPSAFAPSKKGRILRVTEDQYLEVANSATMSLQLARITLTELVA
ncbi:hypothetical protein HQQ81_09290 [Microbacteriaceae bacterium VKM Ac-2854]|nr:hypothetical protein [Microbacteriaceae bacterium VKM Ac-2854]